MIWLAGHGTAWLAGRLGDDPPSGRGVGWFRHVASVAFSLDGAKPADDLPAWLRGLRDRGINRLWLVAGEAAPGPFEERYLVAFAGAGSWSLVGTGHAGESWRSTWT